jgi:hypothetical protein
MNFHKIYLLLFLVILSCSKDKMNGDITIIDDQGDMVTIDPSANRKSVGDSANDLLAEVTFETLHVEIFYVKGLQPTAATLQNFEDFLIGHLHKSGGIEIELKEIESPGQTVYSIADIRNLEDGLRTAYNSGSKITVFGLYIDGEYSENTENGSVLGVAYRNTSFVIFEETIKSFSGQPLAPSTTVLETTVLNHEFGHLMGMVNAGSPPQSDHQDTAHGRHCTTENCLMYWTAETGEGLLNMISGGTIPTFDDLCVEDLQANGGK